MARAIVLVGHEDDEHSDHLESLLRAQGVNCVRISARQLPGADFYWDAGSRAFRLGAALVPRGAGALWRRPGAPTAASYAPMHQRFVHSESSDAFAGVLDAIGLSWLSSPHSVLRAERKPYQLGMAVRLGLPIPKTIITNSSADAVAFADALEEVVVKPIRYGLVSTDPPMVSWAQVMTSAALRSLAGPPVIIQQRIRAAEHLRVVAVGSSCFISTLQTDDLDWRVDIGNHQRFQPSDDHGDVRRWALAMNRSLNIGLSAQDWMVDGNGNPFFLEANPSGQWLFLDRAHDGRISMAIAERLRELGEAIPTRSTGE